MKIETAEDTLVIDDLFEDSKYFLEKARKHEDTNQPATRRYLRASVITSFAALEAYVNTMLFILEGFADLELHERAFAQEKRIELMDEGYFDIRGQQFRSLEQKIKFLHWRMEGTAIPKGNTTWKAFRNAVELRNRLVHPKPGQLADSKLTVVTVKACLIAVLKVSKMLGGPRLRTEEPTNG